MNYRSFIDKLINYSSANPIVEYACEGDIYEVLNSKENKYGTIVWVTDNLSLEDGNMTVTGNLIYADRLLADNSNKVDIQSAGITAMQSIITNFVNDSDDEGMSVEYISMTPYTEKFADLCAGAYINVSFTFLTDVACADENDFDVNTISITKNGTYDVTGYDKADVNVLPVSDSITITKNGTYLPKDYGVDAFDKVEVNVSPNYYLIDSEISLRLQNKPSYRYEVVVVPLELRNINIIYTRNKNPSTIIEYLRDKCFYASNGEESLGVAKNPNVIDLTKEAKLILYKDKFTVNDVTIDVPYDENYNVYEDLSLNSYSLGQFYLKYLKIYDNDEIVADIQIFVDEFSNPFLYDVKRNILIAE